MKKTVNIFLPALLLLNSCGQVEQPEKRSETEKASSTSKSPAVPLTRTTVKDAPVAEHSEKTDDPLNDWYFSVKLYETPTTFHYLIKLQFEEIRGEDTLKLPNLGVMPQPVIRKGSEKYSCIIGFMDHENNFREYKKVYVKNNSLKITALKHYAVSGG